MFCFSSCSYFFSNSAKTSAPPISYLCFSLVTAGKQTHKQRGTFLSPHVFVWCHLTEAGMSNRDGSSSSSQHLLSSWYANFLAFESIFHDWWPFCKTIKKRKDNIRCTLLIPGLGIIRKIAHCCVFMCHHFLILCTFKTQVRSVV